MDWFRAIRRGDAAKVAGLLLTSIRTRDEKGRTGLMEAIQRRNYSIALTLMQYENGMTNDTGETALMHLCRAFNPFLILGPDAKAPRTATWALKQTEMGSTAQFLGLLRLLVFYEAGKCANDGTTALMLAVESGNYDAAVLLGSIESGLSCRRGWSEPLYLILRGHSDRVLLGQDLKYDKPPSAITALMLASFIDNIQAVRLFFSKEWGRRDKNGRSALMFACIGGHIEIASILWHREKGMRDIEGRTAIMYAAVYGHIDIVRLLAAAEGQTEDLMGWTAITYAVVNWQHDVLAYLVENFYTITQGAMYTALQYAAAIGNFRAVDCLLKKEGRISTYTGESALILAAKYTRLFELCQERESMAILEKFAVEEATMFDVNHRTALMHAVLNGNNSAILLLLPYEGGLVDKDSRSSLYYALEKGNIEAANALYPVEKRLIISEDWTDLMLVCVGCDTEGLRKLTIKPRKQTRNGLTALMISCQIGFGDGVRALCDLEAGYKDVNGRSALMFAICNKFSVGIESLINKECRMQDALGMTALMHLLLDNYGPYAETLATLEAGLVDNTGMTALMYAARAGVAPLIEILAKIEHGIATATGQTALMFASQAGHADCVSVLAPMQAKKVDNRGLTAMMLAAYRGHTSVVQVLLHMEACMQDKQGRTALVYAIFGQHKEVIRMLLDAEKDIPTHRGKTAQEYAMASLNPNLARLFSKSFNQLQANADPDDVGTPTINDTGSKSESRATPRSLRFQRSKKALKS